MMPLNLIAVWMCGLAAGSFISVRITGKKFYSVSLANALLWAAFTVIGSGIRAVICAAAVSVSLMIFLTDLRQMIIYDRHQAMLLFLGIMAAIFDRSVPLYSRFAGFIAGFMLFWMIGAAVGHFTSENALGGGDIKLSACMGLLLGLAHLLESLLIASAGACAVIVITRTVKGKKARREYPFGPFLTAGLIAALIFL